MPELPEVTTTTKGLQKVLPGLSFVDAWTDLAKKNPIKQFEGTLKDETFYKKFKKEIIGAKVLNVERRAKNILINLSNNKTILIHLKMTGHLLYGNYVFHKKENTWTPTHDEREAFHDPYNRFIHVVFTLSNGKHLAFCDARKFGKVTLLDTDTAHDTSHLKSIGPEPLDARFTFSIFKERIMRKLNGNIKTVLMDQTNIAGVGNIYSDEALWLAGIHPESKPKATPFTSMKQLYDAVKEVLNKGIDFGGDSTSDYRDINGMRGRFQGEHNAYRKTKEKCSKRGCKGVILRKVIGGRSAHFCSVHQKLFT
ncbi:MAG: bifunctional DNA-formamidopyrimidine glycosylase/DNA-(apurinic or apyrimidinic site) lyase [Candidatus Pacebacteria bacterium]|jgi:formamidopyrimidine-DNA glycosylase|nr:bifunctional DNA-formamidopyrimidine glycosylase/DNA-(apurinic or apyrimidinic site) lyase [Candidatus Paceibacterota bacterium]